jgi:hypothetical protein
MNETAANARLSIASDKKATQHNHLPSDSGLGAQKRSKAGT